MQQQSSSGHTSCIEMPPVGLGTYLLDGDDTIKSAITSALRSGYRRIDCAPVYFNEHHVGDALASAFDDGIVTRNDLFLASKLAPPFMRREHVEPALRKTLSDLRVEYLDLFLIHWPAPMKFVPIDDDVRGWRSDAIDDSGNGQNLEDDVSVHETWSAMEELVRKGLVRNIGVSNFPVALLHELLTKATIPPSVNQVELHPYNQQPKLLEYCRRQGVALQAYSPLGTPGYKEAGEPSVLEDPTLVQMAREKGATASRLALSWALQRGTSVVVKAASEKHQVENLAVTRETERVVLSESEMEKIASLDRGYRFFRPEDWWGEKGYAVFN